MTYQQGTAFVNVSELSTQFINPKPSFGGDLPEFNPTLIKIDYEEALEEIGQLEDHRISNNGSSELHSGIHPVHGNCIIIISDSSATVIPFA